MTAAAVSGGIRSATPRNTPRAARWACSLDPATPDPAENTTPRNSHFIASVFGASARLHQGASFRRSFVPCCRSTCLIMGPQEDPVVNANRTYVALAVTALSLLAAPIQAADGVLLVSKNTSGS